MSLLSRLFGGGGSAPSEPEPEIYKDVAIFGDPINEGGRFRLGARLQKEINGEVKTHMLIRADTFGSHEEALEVSVSKAKMVIDQQGDKLFR